jgi:hypothetical protein
MSEQADTHAGSTWHEPQLIVLVRFGAEESVLGGCKGDGKKMSTYAHLGGCYSDSLPCKTLCSGQSTS